MGMLFAIAAPALVTRWTHPAAAFLFTALFLTPMVFNALFHLAASIYFRSYSPGTSSAVALFPALCWYLVDRFSDAGLLNARSALAAAVLGAAFHGIDLASTTFFLRRQSARWAARTQSTGRTICIVRCKNSLRGCRTTWGRWNTIKWLSSKILSSL